MRSEIERNNEIVWEELLSDKRNIVELFKSIGLDNYVLVNIRNSYTIDNNRWGMIVTVRKKDTGNLTKIIIDSIHGEATWDQLMDTTFGIGNDCESRIILYDKTPIYSGCGCEYNVGGYGAKGFMAINNHCNVPTYIVKVSILTTEIGKSYYQYQLEDEQPLDSSPINKRDHSREYFENIEFWITFSEMKDPESHMLLNPEHWSKQYDDDDFFEYSKYAGNIDFNATWNQSGYFFYINTYTTSGVDKWKYIYENYYIEFYAILAGLEVHEIEESDKGKKIIIKILNQPFTSYAYGTEDQQCKFIEDINKVEKDIMRFYDNIIYEEYEYLEN